MKLGRAPTTWRMCMGSVRGDCKWDDGPRLSSLSGDQRAVLLRQRDYFGAVSKRAVERVCERCGKGSGQEIHVDLQIACRVQTMHRQHSATVIGGREQIESDRPGRRSLRVPAETWLVPAKAMRTAARRRLDQFERKDFTSLQIKLQFKAVEVVAAEGGQQNAADLLVTASDFELFGRAADRQI